MTNAIIPRPSLHRRKSTSEGRLLTFPPERHSELVRRPAGIIKVPGKLAPAKQNVTPPRLLLNVTIEKSLGPVHVVMSSENTVGDLIRAAVEMYVGEKRRPLLAHTDPRRFELHYSQFSLESLKMEEKLIKLGSRNFFLCSKRVEVECCCSKQAKKEAINDSLFALTKLMDILL
ncbi:hypothetical protein UlMin_042615 [Ulmus minor]